MESTILIVDDQPVFRQGLRLLLEKEKDLRVVGEADDGQTAIDLMRRHMPDLVGMGMNLPNCAGIEATRQMLSECPDTRVVALSVHADTHMVRGTIQAGASGYILKASTPEEMIEGIRTVLSGDVYLSPSISNLLVADYKTLVAGTGHTQESPPLPILHTKLHRPPITAHIVPRTRLIDLLEHGVRHPLTLIAAPAGYGKSILASQWLELSALPGAWVSLDTSDNDLRVFVGYVLEAIQHVFPQQEFKSQSLLRAAELPSIPVITRYLLNDLDTLSARFILVLDDFHRIHTAAIYDFIGQLLVHPSPIMHLALLTRRDPPLPLLSLRSRGMVTEITTAHLRFTLAETQALWERLLPITITDKTARILEEQMEGWVTGLHLAALSISNQADQERVIDGLLETPQYVQDYLIQEVLAHVPPQFRPYLPHSAIVDRFCAPLCDALSAVDAKGHQTAAEASGQDFIEWVIQTNLFVITLDATHRWLRYHHLFQDILQRELHQQATAQEIAMLHARASAWFESQGLITDAIVHALAAGDVVRAAEIIEGYRHDEFMADRWYVVQRWLTMLPAGITQERPALLLTKAWIANCRHHLGQIPLIIEQLESLFAGQTVDTTLLGEFAFFQGNIQYWEGQAERSQQRLEKALSLLTVKQNHIQGESELLLGLARCMAGQKERVVRALEERLQGVDSPEGYFHSRLLAGLVFIHLLCGNLSRARMEAQRLHRVATTSRIRNTAAWSAYLTACTHLHANELDAASHHFTRAAEQRYVLETQAEIDALAGLALTQQLMQQPDVAAETMDRLLDFVWEMDAPHYVAMAHSCRARLFLLRGELAPALQWARSVTATLTPSALFMWLEVPSITQARVLIAGGDEESVGQALELLRAIRQQSEACRFTCQTIEVAVLQTLALEKLGRSDGALEALEEAVALAQPGGWIRPFVEAGPLMADVLKRLHKQNVAVHYIPRILDAFSDQAASSPTLPVTASPHPQLLSEPLTHRELDVLALLSQRLHNREIAEKLFITTATVKGHLKNIYQKLDASNRREAVENAKALGILANQ
jgi:LuxR family maltose regulon positive regulatory protein